MVSVDAFVVAVDSCASRPFDSAAYPVVEDDIVVERLDLPFYSDPFADMKVGRSCHSLLDFVACVVASFEEACVADSFALDFEHPKN